MLLKTSIKQRYGIQRKKYSTLNSITTKPLISLLKAFESYKGKSATRNLLIFTLLVPLRSNNARNLKISDIQEINEKYAIKIKAENSKTNKEKNTYIGILDEIALWLKEIYKENDGKFIFILDKKWKPLSENTPNKAIKNMKIDGIEGSRKHLNFHSLRSFFSSYTNENGVNNRDVELALTHKIGGVEAHYNRSSGIENSRRALIWWFNYIREICLEDDVNLKYLMKGQKINDKVIKGFRQSPTIKS